VNAIDMKEFSDALNRRDSQACLSILDSNPALATAIVKNNFDQIETPLVSAMKVGDAVVVDRLLQLGAKMNIVHGTGRDRDTAMTLVLDYSRGDKIPNRLEVRDVLVKHYGDRQVSEKGQSLLNGLKEKTEALFKSFVDKVDGLVRSEAFGLAGLAAPGAALGAVVGVSATGAVLAPAAGTAVLGAAAVGVGMFALHKIRDQLGLDEHLREQRYAENFFKQLVKEEVARTPEVAQKNPLLQQDVKGRPMSISQIDEDLELLSLVQAENFIKKINAPTLATNTERGRYSGPVLFASDHHVVQDAGRGKVVIHEKAKLGMNDKETLEAGKMLKIAYTANRGNDVSQRGQGKELGPSR